MCIRDRNCILRKIQDQAQVFQHLMDGILREVNFAFVCLDDILVASPNLETHQWHLREWFMLLSSHGVSINRKKCVNGQQEVKYLGIEKAIANF